MKGARLNTNGTQIVIGSNTFHFIHRKEVSNGRKKMYAQFCCDIWLQKDEIYRTRLTASGDCLDYNGKISTETAGLKTI